MLIGVAAFSLLALVGIGFLIYWLVSGSNYDTEMMAYLPADTNLLVGLDAESLMANDKVKGYWQKFAQSGELKKELSEAEGGRRYRK